MIVQRDGEGRRHSFHDPLSDPTWLPSDGDSHMRPTDPVLGLAFAGGAWALPWWIIKNHHVANLMLGDLPVMAVL